MSDAPTRTEDAASAGTGTGTVAAEMAAPARRTGLYGRVAIVVLNLIILLALIETGCWLAAGSSAGMFDDALSRMGYSPYRMNKVASAHFPLNADGFRAKPLDQYPRDDRYTIVFLGGSVCMGMGGANGQPLSELLEAELHRAGMAKAQVVNLGQGGAVAAQELAILVHYGLPLKPRMVVSFNGANDLLRLRPLGGVGTPGTPYLNDDCEFIWDHWENGSNLGRMLAHTYTARRLGKIARRLGPSPRDKGPAVPIETAVSAYVSQLDIVTHLARGYGIRHLVALQPSVFAGKTLSDEEGRWIAKHYTLEQRAHAERLITHARTELGRWGAANAVTTIDLTDAFLDQPATVYLDSVHFANQLGYPRLLEAMAAQNVIRAIGDDYAAWGATHLAP
jgi:hypothetical protein